MLYYGGFRDSRVSAVRLANELGATSAPSMAPSTSFPTSSSSPTMSAAPTGSRQPSDVPSQVPSLTPSSEPTRQPVATRAPTFQPTRAGDVLLPPSDGDDGIGIGAIIGIAAAGVIVIGALGYFALPFIRSGGNVESSASYDDPGMGGSPGASTPTRSSYPGGSPPAPAPSSGPTGTSGPRRPYPPGGAAPSGPTGTGGPRRPYPPGGGAPSGPTGTGGPRRPYPPGGAPAPPASQPYGGRVETPAVSARCF